MSGTSIVDIKMLIIFGLSRSGSKLLRDLLNNHSKISLTNFIPTIYEKYGKIETP